MNLELLYSSFVSGFSSFFGFFPNLKSLSMNLLPSDSVFGTYSDILQLVKSPTSLL